MSFTRLSRLEMLQYALGIKISFSENTPVRFGRYDFLKNELLLEIYKTDYDFFRLSRIEGSFIGLSPPFKDLSIWSIYSKESSIKNSNLGMRLN